MLRRIHRLVERRKVNHPQHFGARQFRQLQSERLRHGQSAFAADKQMREIYGPIGCVRALVLVAKDIEVVARHTSQDFGPMGIYLRLQLLSQLLHKFTHHFCRSCALVKAP